MFSSFVNKMVPLGAVGTAGLILYRQVKNSLRLNPVDLRKYHMEQSFSEILQISSESVKILLPRLKEIILTILNSGSLVENLRKSNTDKGIIWEEFKVTAFSQVFVTIISMSYLIILSHIQFAVLMGINNSQEYPDPGCNVCEKFLNKLPDLCLDIKEKVRSSLENLFVKERITLPALKNIMREIEVILQADIGHLYKLVLGENDTEVSAAMHDVLTLTDTADLHQELIAHGLDNCLRSLSSSFPASNNFGLSFSSSSEGNFEVIVAKLIPVLCDCIHNMTSDVRNGLLQQYLNIPKLTTHTANIYECFMNK